MINDNCSKPKVVISRCIEFDKCRWNGVMIGSPIVSKMKQYFDFIPVCPEADIGLGVPRKPVRLVSDKIGKVSIVNSEEGDDHTAKMTSYCLEFLKSLPDGVTGFLLKNGSPSCGIVNVKVYRSHGKVPVLNSKGVGVFANLVKQLYPFSTIEDESRLLNLRIREHFLTRLYALHNLQNLTIKMKSLIDYHSKNKYLFMAYNQAELKKAGLIIANHQNYPVNDVYKDYFVSVVKIFSKLPRNSSMINVLLHLFGYFSKKNLNQREKSQFLELLERYRNDQVPLFTLTTIIKMWIARFGQDYLEAQTLLQPFPVGLESLFDSGKKKL